MENIQQGDGYLLVCDGHNRGLLLITYSGMTPGELLLIQMKAFTGAIPFSDKPSRAATLAIARGERPPRPTDPTLTDWLWALTQRCWDQEVSLRPQASEVSRIMRGLSVLILGGVFISLTGSFRPVTLQR